MAILFSAWCFWGEPTADQQGEKNVGDAIENGFYSSVPSKKKFATFVRPVPRSFDSKTCIESCLHPWSRGQDQTKFDEGVCI